MQILTEDERAKKNPSLAVTRARGSRTDKIEDSGREQHDRRESKPHGREVRIGILRPTKREVTRGDRGDLEEDSDSLVI